MDRFDVIIPVNSIPLYIIHVCDPSLTSELSQRLSCSRGNKCVASKPDHISHWDLIFRTPEIMHPPSRQHTASRNPLSRPEILRLKIRATHFSSVPRGLVDVLVSGIDMYMLCNRRYENLLQLYTSYMPD